MTVLGLKARCWTPPAEGSWKINTDAALDSNRGVRGIGIIIRNHNGLVCASSMQKLQTHFMPQIAEGVALLRGIKFAANLGLFPTSLESTVCDSSPRVFDSLFMAYAHMKKFRNATDVFCQMKDYGFFPIVESCNKYISSLLDLNRTDIALGFYKEMQRCRISPNVYTLNMVVCAFCKLGKLENTVQVFKEMECMGLSPTVASYNTLIAGHCLCKQGKTKKAAYLVKDLDKGRISSTPFSCINHDKEWLSSEQTYFRDVDVYFLHTGILSEICSGLCRCGNDQLAIKLLNEMEIKRLLPEGFDKARTNNSKLENYDKEVGNNP
ncbi:hypothetical protein JRO89_XS01G0119500 [Xanthoceras sorbifolium]|uniref:RNase H type-1 domain-containing protein n=1 Tax=Xanthoceras sorbifolium TaxID=99658 RepID=A0ABQ8IJF9_9ROSI|nr:hypothetical protein JRO89_XS01G0119500 [Xanthoceras sorbifolium]